ncbi:MAG: peptidylprolyl isomerase [archaeon]
MKKMLIISATLILAFTLLGCTQPTGQDNNPGGNLTGNFILDRNSGSDKNANIYNNLDQIKVVKSGDNISVNYTGKLTDGSVFDTSIGRSPLEFTVGAGQMIKGFDTGVLGMKIGETKTITLSPNEAYGEYDKTMVRTFDKNAIPNFGNSKVGDKLTTSTGQTVTIIAKTDTNATIDFNHELAGKTLIFEITLISIN